MVNSRVHYRYLLSLPERVFRFSLGALSGGLLKETGDIALPSAIRRTVLYRTMVAVTLRFLIEDVGEVAGIYLRIAWRKTSFCSGLPATALNSPGYWPFAHPRFGFSQRPALAANGGSLMNRIRRLIEPTQRAADNLTGTGAENRPLSLLYRWNILKEFGADRTENGNQK